MFRIKYFAVVAFTVLLASSTYAGDDAAEIAGLIDQANKLMASGELKEAHDQLEKALKIDENDRAALAAIGKIEVEWEDWSKANSRFEKILENDETDLEAQYYRGVCYRETGKFKALLLRRLDFGKSERHFKYVLSVDSLFKDAVYQYAVLQRYRDKYTEAIELGHEMIRLKPDMIGPQKNLFRLYRYFLDHKGEDEVIRWLRRQPWDHARYFVGEKFRLEKKFDRADSIFAALLLQPLQMNKQAIRLSQAKSFYEQGKLTAGENAYFAAVDSISSELDAALMFEDLKYVLNQTELADYRAIEDPEGYRAFFRRVWTRRDPTPAARVNIRLAEHYRRLAYAERNFEYDGFKTWFNNPDRLGYFSHNELYDLNDQFNDKGLIFIRHGPPDDRAVSLSQFTASNESWLYYETGERDEMTFHFVVDNNATGNNWRLTPFITDPNMLQDRVQWGPIYHQLLTATPTERMSYEQEMAANSTNSAEVGFNSDRHTWSEELKPLEIAYYSAAFRAPDGKSYLDIYYAIPRDQFEKDQDEHAESVMLEKGVALHDDRWRKKHRMADQLVVNLADLENSPYDHFLDAHRLSAEPGEYHVAIHTRQLDSEPNKLGGFNFDENLPNFYNDSLQLSDIVLAYDIEPDPGQGVLYKEGFWITPNPSKKFDNEEPLHLYYEVYNLKIRDDGIARFDVEYKVKLLKEKKKGLSFITGIFGGGGKSTISLTAERESPLPTSIEQIALDLSEAKSGTYELTVTVTDKATRLKSSSSVELDLD